MEIEKGKGKDTLRGLVASGRHGKRGRSNEAMLAGVAVQMNGYQDNSSEFSQII
jgi:hypothetical protein